MSKGWNNYSYLSVIIFLVPLVCSCIILSRLGAANTDVLDGDSHFKVIFQLVSNGQRSDRAIILDGINGGFKAYDCANRNTTTAPYKCIPSPCHTFVYDADAECFCGRRYFWDQCVLNYEIENRCASVATAIDMYAIGCGWFAIVLLLSIIPHAISALVFWPSEYTSDRRHLWAFLIQAPISIICIIFLAVGIHGADSMREAECTSTYGHTYSLASHGYVEKGSVHVVRICASISLISQVTQLLALICWRGYMAANDLEDGSSSVDSSEEDEISSQDDDEDQLEEQLLKRRRDLDRQESELLRIPRPADVDVDEEERTEEGGGPETRCLAPRKVGQHDPTDEEIQPPPTPVRVLEANLPSQTMDSPSPSESHRHQSGSASKRRLFTKLSLTGRGSDEPEVL